MKGAVAGPLVVAAAALACAQPQAPPGGERDEVPPRVVAVSPTHLDTVSAFRDPVVFRFDERISERFEGVQDLEDAVFVSPRTGTVRAERGRRSVEVSIAGGWQAGQVYQVVILPVLRDLFGNQVTESVQLVFSTGGAITPTALAGFVEDRLTGEMVEDARVEAVRGQDSAVYQAVTDTSGFFSLRFIPPDDYEVRAWQDRDRDGEVDYAEPQAVTGGSMGPQDTLVLELALLPMDTTPAQLTVADVLDSTRVVLLFDDYFAPGPVDGTAALYRLPDSTFVADAALVHGSRLDSLQARDAAIADSVRALADSVAQAAEDSIRRLVVDTLLVEPDTAEPDTTRATPDPEPADRDPDVRERPGQGAQEPADAAPLPARELIMILPAPLVPGVDYVVVVEGVTNIRDVPGGGGSARFQAPTPADTADTEPPDAAPDTVPPPP